VHDFAEQIRPWVKSSYTTLGTDGFGRSDSREKLRNFFEVDRYFVTVAALSALADDNVIETRLVGDAIKKYNINPEKPDPSIS
jgi:pyruvate dehydrogenase E1 component